MKELCECCGQVLVDGDHPVWSALAAVVAAMLIADLLANPRRR